MHNQNSPGFKIETNMKIMLELDQHRDSDESTPQKSLNSNVEEILDDGHFLIGMPIYKGAYYQLPGYKNILAYLFSKSRMFSTEVQFVGRIVRDNITYAKMLQKSDLVHNQRRNSFRLQCTLPLFMEPLPPEDPAEASELPQTMARGQMIDLSCEGVAFFTDEALEPGDIRIISFNIGTEEKLEAAVINVQRAHSKEHDYKASVRFNHNCQNQRDRIYKYIVEQQLEILRKLGADSELLKPD